MAVNYAVDQYRQVKVQTSVQAADPHRLVAMLFEGAMEKIMGARVRMVHGGGVAEKGELISRAIAILDALRAGLDKEQGGEIAQNLDALYEYMENRLLEANLRNDTAALDEVLLLLRNIAEAWGAIGAPAMTAQESEPPRVSFSAGA
jgi:flagellar protein FliS